MLERGPGTDRPAGHPDAAAPGKRRLLCGGAGAEFVRNVPAELAEAAKRVDVSGIGQVITKVPWGVAFAVMLTYMEAPLSVVLVSSWHRSCSAGRRNR